MIRCLAHGKVFETPWSGSGSQVGWKPKSFRAAPARQWALRRLSLGGAKLDEGRDESDDEHLLVQRRLWLASFSWVRKDKTGKGSQVRAGKGDRYRYRLGNCNLGTYNRRFLLAKLPSWKRSLGQCQTSDMPGRPVKA